MTTGGSERCEGLRASYILLFLLMVFPLFIIYNVCLEYIFKIIYDKNNYSGVAQR